MGKEEPNVPRGGVDTTRLLVEAMKVAELNHKYLANNVANADTPRFNPTRLDFQKTLRAAMEGRGQVVLRTTDSRHLDFAHARPYTDRVAHSSKNDYNKVDIDQEMAALSENTGNYTLYGSLLVKRFQVVKNMLTSLR
jgi:flagellar basal-body rod protein FlgB